MSLFTNKKVWQKLLIIFLIIILFQAVFMKPAHAVDADILLKPITGLFVGLADALEGVMQKIVLGVDESLFEIKNNSDFWANFLVIGLFIVGTAVAIIAAIPTGGASLGIMGVLSVVGTVTTRFIIALSTYAIFGQLVTTLVKDSLMDTYYLPQYELSPYEIFSDKITVLDVDFFNPKNNTVVEADGTSEKDVDLSQMSGVSIGRNGSGVETYIVKQDEFDNRYNFGKPNNNQRQTNSSTWSFRTQTDNNGMDSIGVASYEWEGNGKKYKAEVSDKWLSGGIYKREILNMKEIVQNTKTLKSPAKELQPYIAGWYKTLRNLALVILLSILVYVGIRITLSSIASDKAKYKQMLIDWIVAVCLLFLMHYIMSFSVYIVKELTDMILSIQNSSDEQIGDAKQKIIEKRLGTKRYKWK